MEWESCFGYFIYYFHQANRTGKYYPLAAVYLYLHVQALPLPVKFAVLNFIVMYCNGLVEYPVNFYFIAGESFIVGGDAEVSELLHVVVSSFLARCLLSQCLSHPL